MFLFEGKIYVVLLNYTENKIRGIKSWAEDDRPREKLLNKSRKSLSDAELLAIVIGSGTANRSALEVSQSILRSVSNNLNELARLDIHDLLRFKGIGKAKASNIMAVMELGRRRRLSEGLKKASVTCSRDAFEIMDPIIGDLSYEEFWLLLLNRGQRIQRSVCISEGSVSGTVADPKKIFKIALENNASGVILCHNHPSGLVNPSANDQRITKKCKEAGSFLDLPVIDHLIVAGGRYFSFADEGLL